ERLAGSGEMEAAREALLAEFSELAERAYAERFSKQEEWSAALELEHDNLRVALELARGRSPEEHLRMAGALAWFWQLNSHYREGQEHLSAALATAAGAPPRPARARALWGLANVLQWRGEHERARPLAEEALGDWRALGEKREVALALEGIGLSLLLGERVEEASA